MSEVIEEKTGYKMSHMRAGETMGSTLFDSTNDALQWIIVNDLQTTHTIRKVKK